MAEDPTIIEITNDEVTPSHLSKHYETSEKLYYLLDAEKNIWITEGVPVVDLNAPNPVIDVPNEPHVFMVHDLKVTDKDHVDIKLENTVVIFAHGYRDGDNWKFANGQSVSDTVNLFNERAKKNGTPGIEFVIACNNDSSPNPLGVRIKDVTDKYVAQATGENVVLNRREFNRGGKVSMSITVNGELWGLDDLLVYKQIETNNEVENTDSHVGDQAITINIDGEEIEVVVPQDISVGFSDILQGEVNSILDIKEQVGGGDTTQYHSSVLGYLRDDIRIGRDSGKNDKQIYVSLATRYHPDLYQGANEEVKNLAKEYFQALGSLKKIGEIKP